MARGLNAAKLTVGGIWSSQDAGNPNNEIQQKVTMT